MVVAWYGRIGIPGVPAGVVGSPHGARISLGLLLGMFLAGLQQVFAQAFSPATPEFED